MPAPLSTHTPPNRSRIAAAAANRSACTSPVDTPSSRAASPGWGVSTQSSRRGADRPAPARWLSASASTTRSPDRQPSAFANIRSPHSSRPSPGPTATTVARPASASNDASSSTPRLMTSGRIALTAAACASRVRDAHEARADPRGGFGGETDRAREPPVASDQEHVAVVSLVGSARARSEARMVREPVVVESRRAGRDPIGERGRDSERVVLQAPAVVRPRAGQEPPFRRDEGDGERSAHRQPPDASGVGVQP